MLKHDWPLIPDDPADQYDAKGCLRPRDDSYAWQRADGEWEVMF